MTEARCSNNSTYSCSQTSCMLENVADSVVGDWEEGMLVADANDDSSPGIKVEDVDCNRESATGYGERSALSAAEHTKQIARWMIRPIRNEVRERDDV